MSLTHITTCLLCDPKAPKQFAAEGVTPGLTQGESMGNLGRAMVRHLEQKHPEAYKPIAIQGLMFMALLSIPHYSSTDPGIGPMANLVRHFIHTVTRKNGATDSELDNRFACGDAISRQLRDLRDYLLEEGEYAPKAPEPSRIVTA